MVRRKVADSNTMKNLVLLLLRKDDDNSTKPAATTSDGPAAALPGVDEAAFTNKAMVLDVLYALSNLDSFENEVDAGDMGERVIKAGGCVITCALLNRLAAEQQQQQQQQQPALGAEHDARTKARVEVIRAAVGLLSSMAFVTGTPAVPSRFVLASFWFFSFFFLKGATRVTPFCVVTNLRGPRSVVAVLPVALQPATSP